VRVVIMLQCSGVFARQGHLPADIRSINLPTQSAVGSSRVLTAVEKLHQWLCLQDMKLWEHNLYCVIGVFARPGDSPQYVQSHTLGSPYRDMGGHVYLTLLPFAPFGVFARAP
jgi:hypothetical protein